MTSEDIDGIVKQEMFDVLRESDGCLTFREVADEVSIRVGRIIGRTDCPECLSMTIRVSMLSALRGTDEVPDFLED